MTKDSTGKVLEGILNDADAAGQVAAGDFTSFADEDLTGAERALLQAAADEVDDDVSGFASYIKFDGVDGESKSVVFPKVEIAFNYVGNLGSFSDYKLRP